MYSYLDNRAFINNYEYKEKRKKKRGKKVNYPAFFEFYLLHAYYHYCNSHFPRGIKRGEAKLRTLEVERNAILSAVIFFIIWGSFMERERLASETLRQFAYLFTHKGSDYTVIATLSVHYAMGAVLLFEDNATKCSRDQIMSRALLLGTCAAQKGVLIPICYGFCPGEISEAYLFWNCHCSAHSCPKAEKPKLSLAT